jgi:hypothetical protein
MQPVNEPSVEGCGVGPGEGLGGAFRCADSIKSRAKAANRAESGGILNGGPEVVQPSGSCGW